MPNNAGEIARELEEERYLLLQGMRRPISKNSKENYLRRIREIERELGIEGVNYNDERFGQ